MTSSSQEMNRNNGRFGVPKYERHGCCRNKLLAESNEAEQVLGKKLMEKAEVWHFYAKSKDQTQNRSLKRI